MRALALAALLVAAVVHAHSFDPALLDLRERDAGIYDVIWKSPVPVQEGFVVRPLTPVFSAPCRRAADLTARGT